jgi:hypothetical protein
MKVPANVTRLNALLGQYDQRNNVTVTSSILSSTSNDVVKLMIAGANTFYCADTLSGNSAVVTAPYTEFMGGGGDNFTSLTDCSGQPLK